MGKTTAIVLRLERAPLLEVFVGLPCTWLDLPEQRAHANANVGNDLHPQFATALAARTSGNRNGGIWIFFSRCHYDLHPLQVMTKFPNGRVKDPVSRSRASPKASVADRT